MIITEDRSRSQEDSIRKERANSWWKEQWGREGGIGNPIGVLPARIFDDAEVAILGASQFASQPDKN